MKVFAGNDCSGPSVSWSISNDEIAQQKNNKAYAYTYIDIYIHISIPVYI